MITCRERAEERARTLEQFEELEFAVHVFEDTHPVASPDRNRWNVERVILAAIEQQTDLLLVEDDIDLAPDFPRALERARLTGEIVTFWLENPVTHPTPYGKLLREHNPAAPVGFYRVDRMKDSWYGTQAVLLPLWVLRALVDRPLFGVPNGQPFDRWLRDQVKRVLVALPNPVQHRSPPSVVNPNRRRRISPTYGMRRAGKWEEATWPSSTSPTLA